MNIPETNLGYPILVTLENGTTGSGFFLNWGKSTYFITAKHVLFKEDQKLKANSAELFCLGTSRSDNNTSTFRLNFDKQAPKAHKSSDSCVFLFSKVISGETSQGNKIAVRYDKSVEVLDLNPKGVICVAKENIKLFNQVEISNNVFLYGYPTSLGLKKGQDIFDYSKPLLRKGIVSNVFSRPKTIILDCPVYYGDSGGPVVQEFPSKSHTPDHYVIGLVSQYIPFVQKWINPRQNIIHEEYMNSGYSVATSLDPVIDLIKSYNS